MIYRKVDPQSDAGKGYLRPKKPLLWAANLGEVSITSMELKKIIGWYPVAFMKTDQGFKLVMPFPISGSKNSFVNLENGLWRGKYLPFLLKSFPYCIMDEKRDSELALLGIAESVEKCISQRAKKLIFDEKGQPTQFHLNLCHTLKKRAARQEVDNVLISHLASLNLLVPWELELGSESRPFIRDDLYKIDEVALLKLSPDQSAKILSRGGGYLVYGHIFSKMRANAPAKLCEGLVSGASVSENAVSSDLDASDRDLFDFDSDIDITKFFVE